MSAPRADRLTTLDYVLSVMDTPESRLNFAIIFHFDKALDFDGLQLGAESARKLFPKTRCRLRRNEWVKDVRSSLNGIRVASCTDPTSTIRDFINRSFDPEQELPVQQLIVTSHSDAKTILVTRFHHAACDGMSAALWLRHQLEVAQGAKAPLTQICTPEYLELKHVARHVRTSKFCYAERSSELFTPARVRSSQRSWVTIGLDATQLRKTVRRAGGFTYSDFLATSALEALSRWNAREVENHSQRLGLWVPINVRKRSNEGFGNGTSRIRIYAAYPRSASFGDKCREIRKQIEWCTDNGEWVVPEANVVTRLPRRISAPVLRRKLSRPSLDMGTGVFSHADRWQGNAEVFNAVDRIECVGLLHRWHALAINAATHRGTTWLTFTYDNGLLTRDDAQQLASIYEEQVHMGHRQL